MILFQTPSSSPSLITKKLLCHHNHNSSNDASHEETPAKRPKNAFTTPTNNTEVDVDVKRKKLDFDLSIIDNNPSCNMYLTSTPACLPLRACSDIDFTPEGQDRKSMSPITRSTQRMTRAMQVCISFLSIHFKHETFLVNVSNLLIFSRFIALACTYDLCYIV